MSTVADSRPWLKDSALTFVGGCNGSFPAHQIGKNQVVSAVNCTMRNGRAKPRHGWKMRPLSYPTNWNAGRFQRASFYDGNGYPMLLSVHGGRVFKVDLRNWVASEISPAGSLNNPNKTIGWSTQAENYWIYQDNESLPIIFDGASCRRSVPSQLEIPVGNVMSYNNGRLAVALPDRYSYRVGDLVFGSSGSATYGNKNAILRFTETQYLNEGGDMQARIYGANSIYGPITCIKALAQPDTTLGQGPVLVGQPNMVFTVNLPFDRTTWKDSPSPLQTASPIFGPLNQDATILVNGDMWYRAIDGIRSYVMARKDFMRWINTPMSSEVSDVLDADTPFLLDYGSGCLFDNRLLMTVSPVMSDMGVWHRGLEVLDFNSVSSLRGKGDPAWDGLWTGKRILQIIKCTIDQQERCFVYQLNDDDEIEIWELVKGLREDNGDTPIVWDLNLRSMDCGNEEQFKALETGRLVFRNVRNRLQVTVQYHSDQAPCVQPWDVVQACATMIDCATPECSGPHNYREQQRSNLKLHKPADGFDEITGWKYRTGYQFQPLLHIVGYGELESMRIYAVDEPETLSADSNT